MVIGRTTCLSDLVISGQNINATVIYANNMSIEHHFAFNGDSIVFLLTEDVSHQGYFEVDLLCKEFAYVYVDLLPDSDGNANHGASVELLMAGLSGWHYVGGYTYRSYTSNPGPKVDLSVSADYIISELYA